MWKNLWIYFLCSHRSDPVQEFFSNFVILKNWQIFSQILAKFTMKKKNPKKLQNVSLQNSNDLMCVMKVALQRFAYIDALY
jgi:hypothetical protein